MSTPTVASSTRSPFSLLPNEILYLILTQHSPPLAESFHRILQCRLINKKCNAVVLLFIFNSPHPKRPLFGIRIHTFPYKADFSEYTYGALKTPPIFLQYLRARVGTAIYPQYRRYRLLTSIALHIEAAISTLESIRPDDDAFPQAMAERKARYLDLLLRSVAVTPDLPHDDLAAEDPGFSPQVKLLSGFILACLVGDTQSMELLLPQVGNHNNKYHHYFGTPLAASARGGHLVATEILLSRGVESCVLGGLRQHENPYWALPTACYEGDEAMVRLLLEKLPAPQRILNPRHLLAPEKLLGASLCHALRGGHVSVVKLLVLDSVRTLDCSLLCTMSLAARLGSFKVMRWILDNAQWRRYLDHGFSNGQGTIFLPAVSSGKLEGLQILLDKGILINPQDRRSAINVAVNARNLEPIKLLVGASPESFSLNGHHVQVAVHLNDFELLCRLLSFISPNKLIELGPRLLYDAVTEGNVEVVRVLLQVGVDPNLPFSREVHRDIPMEDKLPLVLAQNMGFSKIIKSLLEFGANPVHMSEYQHFIGRMARLSEVQGS